MPRKMVLAGAAGVLTSAADGAAGKALDAFDEHAARKISVSKRAWRIDVSLRPFLVTFSWYGGYPKIAIFKRVETQPLSTIGEVTVTGEPTRPLWKVDTT